MTDNIEANNAEEKENDEDEATLDIVTVSEMLESGLSYVKWDENRVERASNASNTLRFCQAYGTTPVVLCTIYEDLQTTDVEASKIRGSPLMLKYLLMTMNFLREYEVEGSRERMWNYSQKWIRDRCWEMVERITAMHISKMVWPSNEEFGPVKVVGWVDGRHIWTEERGHPVWSHNPDYYSHKFNKAGLSFEVVCSLSESRIIWINRPFLAGMSNVTIFKEPGGLKEKMMDCGKVLVGDRGYHHFHQPNSTCTYR